MPRTISVAMIVKDESAHLGECIESIAGLADELCIVDTGSKDDTVDIARRYRAKVSFFIWCDDFSAARNESLRQCTKDWVFVLDADERLAPEDIGRLRALAEGPLGVSYRFTTRNYTNTESVSEFRRCEPGDPYARGFAGWYPSTKVRLFPNNVGGRFQGRVHELVNASLESRGVQVLTSDIPIHHYAYTRPPARLAEKQELYLQLGHQKVKAEPGNPKAYAELGDQYTDVRDYASAAAAYRESLKLDPSNPVVMRSLGAVLHLLKRSEEAKRALRVALQLDPGMSEAWRNLGVIYADEKSWLLSIDCFEQALSLDPRWDEGHRYMAVALEGAGRLPEAAQAAQEALKADPNSLRALELYIHLMLRIEQRAAARDFLSGLLKNGPRDAEIHNALGELYYYDDFYEEAKTHFREAAGRGIPSAYNNLGVVLYRQKLYAEANEAFEQCLAVDPGHRGARTNLQKTMTHLNGGQNGGADKNEPGA